VRVQNRKRRAASRKRVGPRESFLSKLPKTGWWPLSAIASAWFAATGEQQLQLLKKLREGKLIASVNWPTTDQTLELPSELWRDVVDDDFQVRPRHNGNFKRRPFDVDPLLLNQHCIAPLFQHLEGVRKGASLSIDGRVERILDLSADEIGRLIKEDREGYIRDKIEILNKMLSVSSKTRAGVTAFRARAFAVSNLDSGVTTDKRGKRRTAGMDDLLLEIFRCVWHEDEIKQGLQKQVIEEMKDWWAKNSKQGKEQPHWVREQVMRVWKIVKEERTLSST
jgi:hypothetical protein